MTARFLTTVVLLLAGAMVETGEAGSGLKMSQEEIDWVKGHPRITVHNELGVEKVLPFGKS